MSRKMRYIKVYEMKENFNNIVQIGNFRNFNLESDTEDGTIIEHNIFQKEGKLYISCLIELD